MPRAETDEPVAKAETALDCSRTPFVLAATDLTPISAKGSDGTGDTLEATEGQTLEARGIQSGDRVGRFTIDKRLGEGGMGVVYLATDSDLQRKVAIKFIHLRPGRERSQGARRLLREAQATAALSHRNVVTVHEVGMHQGEPYVAMEYLEGLTLRAWIDAEARSWQEILSVFVQAAKGLQAAHEAGLVHRDFKPENVMVCEERVCVVDFGLARSSSSAAEESPAHSYESPEALVGLAEQLTQPGTLLGTPRYMSPEQRERVTVGAQSDQYSFCVSMFEAVYGVVPSSAEVDIASAPQRLHEVLSRGLKESANERYSGMAELIEALEALLPSTKRSPMIWLISLGLLLALGIGTVVVAGGFSSSAPPCAGADKRVAAVWGDTERKQIDHAFYQASGDFGSEQSRRISATIDDYAEQWASRHTSICRATRVEHRQSDTMHDLRMECLEEKLDDLRVVRSRLAAAADTNDVRNAQQVLHLLGPLHECDDTSALRDATPLPRDADERQRVQSLRTQVREVNALHKSGRYQEALLAARTIVAEAREIEYPPLLAVALLALGQAELDIGDSKSAETILTETTKVAALARDDETAADAWSRLVQVIGSDESAPSRAVPLFVAAEAAVVRAGSPPLLDVALNYHIAVVLDYINKPEEALKRLEHAKTVLEPLMDNDPNSAAHVRYADVLFEMGGVVSRRGKEDEGIELTKAAIAIWVEVYGAGHPDVAFGYNNLGESYRHKGELEIALQHHQKALDIRLASLGADSSKVASSLLALANVEDGLSRYDDALKHLDQALSIQERVLPENATDIAKSKLTVATTLKSLERYDEAKSHYDEAIAIFKSHVDTDINLGIAYYNRGELSAKRERYEEALRDYSLAIGEMEKHLGPKHMFLIYPLLGQGTAHIRLEKFGDAIALLERALAMEQAGGADHEIASCKLYLGLALWHQGTSQKRAVALVKAAQAALVGFGAAASSEVEEAKKFLRTLP